MAASTPTTIKNRIVAMFALISGITTSLDDYPEDGKAFQAAELPVAITFLGAATNTRLSGRAFVMSRSLTTHLLIAKASSSRPNPDTSAMEAVEAFQVSVPLYFADKPQLQDPANSLNAIVRNTTLPSEQEPGPGRIPFGGVDYWSLVFTFQVETVHTAS